MSSLVLYSAQNQESVDTAIQMNYNTLFKERHLFEIRVTLLTYRFGVKDIKAMMWKSTEGTAMLFSYHTGADLLELF